MRSTVSRLPDLDRPVRLHGRVSRERYRPTMGDRAAGGLFIIGFALITLWWTWKAGMAR